MIERRVIVNLLAFLGLFALLAAWALGNVFKIDAIERPYTVVAEFETSPGLQPNVETTYLGLSVGSVDSVELVDDIVRVELDINRGVELPEGMSAAVRRKSAVGEPYVALEPPPGDDDPPVVADGYVIPLDRTSVPLSYGELFAAVDELVANIPPDDFAVVLEELAIALEGRGPQLRTILAGADEVTSSLATRSDIFDELADDLTALTAAIADERDGIGSSLDDLSALTGTLVEQRAEIDALLTQAPDFGDRVNGLLEETYADLSCMFEDVGTVFAEVGTADRIEDILRLLQTAGGARDALDAALVQPGEDGADGFYLGGSFGLTPPGLDSPPAYDPYKTLPEPPSLAECLAAGAVADDVPGDAGSAGRNGGADIPGGDRLDVPGRAAPGADEVADTTDTAAGSEAFPLGGTVLALAGLLAVALLAALRPWRWLPVGGRDDEDEESADDA